MGTRVLLPEFNHRIYKVLLCTDVLLFQQFDQAAISHIFEIVASSIDIVSRLGRSELMKVFQKVLCMPRQTLYRKELGGG
jgi:hypothetical protein